jgi:hypothetical protein
VYFHAEFEPEFDALEQEVQDELLAHANLLKAFGPQLKRPTADTLHGSKHDNMKELRFKAAGGSLAHSVCVRSRTKSHIARWRRQIRRQLEAVLPATHQSSGREV